MIELEQSFGKVSLTDRERDILRLLTNGLTDSEIAEAVILTVGTVKWYNRQIYNKLGVHNRTEAITRAQRLGLLDIAAQPSVAAAPTHNLPAQITSFIGRSRELVELKMALLASRLITLTGPPGTGKTRLALEVAAGLLDQYPDGVYFVSLAAIQDAGLVAQAIAQVIDVRETGGASILAALKAALREKQLLLVLDNFEHLLAAASLVSDLLAAAPHLTVLVTSREILRLYGEQEFLVPPLQLPDLKQQPSASALRSYEAVELFIQRAHAAQPGFTLSDSNAAAVATICVHLDGLPLAIELAAARVKFYAPQTLLLRLGNRLEALGEGARDLPARQRTLRATLAWSYDLLTPDEQSLFARLGVFIGGFSPADVEAVCADGLNLEVVSGLESLLNKSLLRQMQSTNDEPRFMMLETMREYALEKLGQRGERSQIEERHARYFIGKCAEAARVWSTHDEGPRLVWMDMQNSNLQATLEWSLAHDPSAQTSLELIASLARFWELRGYFSEAQVWLSKALSLPGSSEQTKAHADAFYGLALLTQRHGDPATAQRLCREALAIHDMLGDKRSASITYVRFSEVSSASGDFVQALEYSQRGYALACEVHDPWATANALCQLGFDNMRFGNYAAAQPVLEEAIPIYQAIDDKIGAALALSGLGELAVRTGNLDLAISSMQLCLRLREELGEKWGVAAALGTLGWIEMMRNNFSSAVDMLKESIVIRKEIGELGGLAWCLEKLAEIAFLDGDDGRAALLLGAAAALRSSINSAIDPTDQPEHDRMIARIRELLGEDVYAAVWEEGQAMPLKHLMEYLAIASPFSTNI